MLDAARQLFATRGYAATSVEAIAQQAGVSPQTFYTAFATKRGVAFALLDNMPAAADPKTLAKSLAVATTAQQQLALLVEYRMRLYAGSLDVLLALRATGFHEPDIGAVWTEGEERRRRNQQDLLEAWHAGGQLRPDVTRHQADDVLWALTGPDMYRLFVVERGWDRETYGDWLVSVLSGQLLSSRTDGAAAERPAPVKRRRPPRP